MEIKWIGNEAQLLLYDNSLEVTWGHHLLYPRVELLVSTKNKIDLLQFIIFDKSNFFATDL